MAFKHDRFTLLRHNLWQKIPVLMVAGKRGGSDSGVVRDMENRNTVSPGQLQQLSRFVSGLVDIRERDATVTILTLNVDQDQGCFVELRRTFVHAEDIPECFQGHVGRFLSGSKLSAEWVRLDGRKTV